MFREKHNHGDSLFPFEFFDQSTCKDIYVVHMHWHEEVEWIYVTKGKIDINVDGEHFYVQENEFFVIESKLLHSIYTLEDCHYYTCVFKKEILDFSFKDYITSKYIHPYIVDELVVNEIIKCDHTSINDFYLQILRCCNEKNLGYQLSIKVSLLNIFNFLIENQYLIPNTRTKHNLESIEVVLDYISNHYSEKLESHFLADLVGYNNQYFSRYFKENTGYPPIEYINYYRISKASEMLVNQDLSILDISINCGFDSCSYFIKKFKELKKVPPKQYRKRLLELYMNKEYVSRYDIHEDDII